MKTDAEKLSDINDLFDFILKVQDKLGDQVVSDSERAEGEGRKGVLMIRGPNKFVRVFEVSRGRLTPSTNLDHARTAIAFETIDSFIQVCQDLLAGDSAAISRAKARGEVKIEGEFAVRDFMVFRDLFSKIGQVLNSYGVKVGS